MSPVAYDKQTINASNPIARFAHRARYSSSLTTADVALGAGGRLLDFGSGQGHFLNLLHGQRPDAVLLGFEPYQEHEAETYTSLRSKETLADGSVDVVTCFETLEHMYDDEIEDFIEFAQRILVPHGKLVVSVPIIGGPTLLLKESNRFILHRRCEYSLIEILRTSLTGQASARAENRRASHKGFDYRVLERRLAHSFALESRQFSPFPAAPWFANSQVFWILSKSRASLVATTAA